MRQFEHREEDNEGKETLEAISAAVNFNKWMYDVISPYCKGKILEIGSGIGNISQFFFNDKRNIYLSDIRKSYRDILLDKFGSHGTRVFDLDLVDPQFETKHDNLMNSFDTVFALNVVEHIEDDSMAILNCHKLLKPGGRIIILVPSYEFLFNQFDKGLGHVKRYNRKMLTTLIEKHFKVLHSQYFNSAGIAGWFVSGSIMKKKIIPKDQMKIYNSLVPVFKMLDSMIFNSFGLSVICVGKKF